MRMLSKDAAGAPAQPLDVEALLKRMPPDRGMAFGLSALGLLLGNGLALYFLVRGEMTPLELVVLVAVEALALSLIARIQWFLTPRAARPPEPEGQGNKLFTLLFGLGWLAVVYYLVFWMYLQSGDAVVAAGEDPLALIAQPRILWPLAITVIFALMDAVQDQIHFRTHGGQFVGTPGFSGMARWLTLFLGAIPFVIPLLVLVMGLATAARLSLGAGRRMPGRARVFSVVLGLNLGLIAALSLTVGGLFKLGVAGWAIGFISAKIASEALMLALPFILARMQAEAAA